jgi:hypothetical protein
MFGSEKRFSVPSSQFSVNASGLGLLKNWELRTEN